MKIICLARKKNDIRICGGRRFAGGGVCGERGGALGDCGGG